MKRLFIRYILRIFTAVILHFIVKLFDQSFYGNILDFGLRGFSFLLFFVTFVLFFWWLSDCLYVFANRFIPSKKQFIKRCIYLVLIYFAYGIIVTLSFSTSYAIMDEVFFNISHYSEAGRYLDLDANVGMFTGYFLVFAFGAQFYLLNHWKETELANQALREENIRSRFEVLRNQIEPHFFFNSLSVLSQLVYNDADKAAEYINRLSKLYRYILEQRNESLVSISRELEVLDAYIYLVKVRYGDTLLFDISIDETTKTKGFIPHNTLQLLAENAIKHNQLTLENPLVVKIFCENNCLVMKNKIQKRINLEPSNGIGIENISHRYSLLCDKKVKILDSNDEFVVELPILNSTDYERTRV